MARFPPSLSTPHSLSLRKNFENWFFVIRAGESGSNYLSLDQAHADGAVTINIGTPP